MMIRLFFYVISLGILVYLIFYWLEKAKLRKPTYSKPVDKFKTKRMPQQWTEVYQTDSEEEANRILAHFEEENIDCIMFEHGKRDIYGQAMRSWGIIVPKTQLARAQNIIGRIPS